MSNREQRRSVGLALGAGGARGLAHVGVLHTLAEAEIPIDAVVGTSSGALVGAAFAAGQLENLERSMRDLEWADVMGILDPVWPRAGIMSGNKTRDWLHGLLGDWQIEDLAVPFGAVAVDLVTGDEILITTGRAVDAIRASISIPGIFVPERLGRRLLVDGAIRNPVPVSQLDAFGCEIRLAVNLHQSPAREIVSSTRPRGRLPIAARVSAAVDAGLARLRSRPRSRASQAGSNGENGGGPNLFEILTASMSIIEYELAQHRLARDPVDLVIEPDVHDIRAFEFQKAGQAIAAGRRAAKESLPELADLLRGRRRRRARRLASSS